MTGILMARVQNKFDARLAPGSDDKITNALSDFQTVSEKRAAYNAAARAGGVYAVDENGTRIMLGRPGTEFNNVEFIAGVWRVQNKFDCKITIVRNREFVLIKKLPRQEQTKFDFYSAELVGNNCYGRYVCGVADYIIAKCGEYSAYGQTLEQARAFLGIKLYDEFQDLIYDEIQKHHSK